MQKNGLFNYTDGKQQLPYFVTAPDDHDPKTEKLPLIIYLHGLGECGTDIEIVKKYCVPALFKKDAQYRGIRAITLAPQCPRGYMWSNYNFCLMDLIGSIVEEYNVDKDRISLTGVSMGGFGTWNIASANPQYFSAIVPICGGGSPGNARAVGKMPVRLYHGNKDDIVPYEMSVIMSKYLEKNGGNFEFITVEGANHDLAYLYETTDILEWMVDQKKN